MRQYTQQELLQLNYRDLERVFLDYLKNKSGHIRDKQHFLLKWVNPRENEVILECGSSSGKTCIDFAKKSRCYMIGVDFDDNAIKVSEKMQKKYFPELNYKCVFIKDDLTKMIFDNKIKKILMPDFSEHIYDNTFRDILNNMKQLQDVKLYIYTPVKTHLFEILKHKNILLKSSKEHINIKTENEMIKFLEKNDWRIIEKKWRPSYLPFVRVFEVLLGNMPVIGKYFHRKMAIIITPNRILSKNINGTEI
ncbi:MAG: class I SAM-dependent methyltransferase [Patescibacteria group bacterium]|nr:class I SAM-dependent methyltransferase [Patescibacteria group bacterium]